MRAFRSVFILAIAAGILVAGASQADARGRSRSSSPFVTTPFGTFPKSVYYGQMLQFSNPAMIEQFRRAEQAYYDKMNKGKSGQGGGTTAKKPSTTKKKV